MTAVDPSPVSARRWRSRLLGEPKMIEVPAGRLECFERGDGPAIVFVHGWFANANLWRRVVPLLSPRFRCVALDLPLGSHREPMDPAADLGPSGCGELIAAALAELGLRDVTLVGNDSGGAYSQIAVAAHPDRIARLVLNSCETPYDPFPPPPFDGLPALASDPVVLRQALAALGDPAVRTSTAAYGLLIKHPIDESASDSYALPAAGDPAILRDVAKVMSAATAAPVQAAGQELIASFTRPVLFVWGSEDQVFPLTHAERYAAELAGGRLALVDDAYSFTPEDQPLQLAEAIADFCTPA
jgi:pimeloyl-ACP methyl ester carboxylesterase